MGFTQSQIEALNVPITADVVKERKGPGGKMLSYLPAFHVIDTANKVFGFDGWSAETTSLNTRVSNEGTVITTAQVRVTVSVPETIVTTDGEGKIVESRTGNVRTIERMGVGHGSSKSAYDYEFAEKEAESDALKRAFRTFGAQFGNSLYDKEVLAELGKTGADDTPPARTFSKPASSGSTSGSTGGTDKPATPNQIKFVSKLLAEKGDKSPSDYGFNVAVEALTFKQASALLDKIQGK